MAESANPRKKTREKEKKAIKTRTLCISYSPLFDTKTEVSQKSPGTCLGESSGNKKISKKVKKSVDLNPESW